MCTHMLTHAHVYTCTYTHTHARISTHTYTHTHVHTRTDTHTHTQVKELGPSVASVSHRAQHCLQRQHLRHHHLDAERDMAYRGMGKPRVLSGCCWERDRWSLETTPLPLQTHFVHRSILCLCGGDCARTLRRHREISLWYNQRFSMEIQRENSPRRSRHPIRSHHHPSLASTQHVIGCRCE